MQYEPQNNPVKTVGVVIGIIFMVAGGISLFIAGEKAMNSARNLDITSFGNDLTSLILIGIVLIIIGIFVEIIFVRS